MILVYLFHVSYIIILPDRFQLKVGPNLIGCGHMSGLWMGKKKFLVVARGGNRVSVVDDIRQCSKQRNVA